MNSLPTRVFDIVVNIWLACKLLSSKGHRAESVHYWTGQDTLLFRPLHGDIRHFRAVINQVLSLPYRNVQLIEYEASSSYVCLQTLQV